MCFLFVSKTSVTDPTYSWYWRKRSWEKLFMKFSGRVRKGLGSYVYSPHLLLYLGGA